MKKFKCVVFLLKNTVQLGEVEYFDAITIRLKIILLYRSRTIGLLQSWQFNEYLIYLIKTRKS